MDEDEHAAVNGVNTPSDSLSDKWEFEFGEQIARRNGVL